MYAITAQVLTYERAGNGYTWQGSRQIPGFCLDETVHGITDEGHAVRIARRIIDPFSALNVIVSAVKVGADCDQPEECARQGCPEHPAHDGPDHTWEQHHGRADHVGVDGQMDPGACRCPGYGNVGGA